jgi:hypothetical protein
LLAASAEPRVLRLIEGDTALEVARRSCGRLTETYLEILAQANPSKGSAQTTAVIPACFATRLNETVKVVPGETWADLATRSAGIAGPKTLNSIFSSNAVAASHTAAGTARASIPKSLEHVKVPFLTEGVIYKAKAGIDAATLASQLRSSLGAANSIPTLPVPADELTLEAGVLLSTGQAPPCLAPIARKGEWPFPVEEVVSVIARNEAHHGPGMKAAVVAIVDNGLDGIETSAFPLEYFEVSALERNYPNDGLDQDGNGVADDVVGTNIHHQGWPRAFPEASSPAHGTMISSLVLGSSEFRTNRRASGSPLHVKIRPVSIVRRTVEASGSGNVTRYTMPTESVARAINYAEESNASIINLSVSTPNRLSEVEDALYNRSNLLLVVAAGNAASDLDSTPRYPAAISAVDGAYRGRVVTVGAHGRTGCLSKFSGRGSSTVDLAAPGEGIRAIGISGADVIDDGTSQATALVSFTAAQLRAAGLNHAAAIKDRLIAGVDLSADLHEWVRSAGTLNIPKTLSLSDDVLERASTGTREYGRLSERLTLNGVCPGEAGGERKVLKVSKRIDGGPAGQVRVLVRTRPTLGALKVIHCKPSAAPATFTSLQGTRITFPWADVRDLVPAW